MRSTIDSSVFYHIYPLGMGGCPPQNDFVSSPGSTLRDLRSWLPQLTDLGVTALYIGPLLESSRHGYDTADYFRIDRRLGTEADCRALVADCHARGIAVVLDAVLNHTGRDFFAFRDLREHGPASRYRDWFHAVDFSRPNNRGDRFSYEGWAGHLDLVKLNTDNPAVREHLFAAAAYWLADLGFDGLRLDAADVLEPGFRRALAAHCRAVKPDCWLLGEVVHGDYREWANPEQFDSVTNYEVYKGLWSSLNDGNYFELAWSLRRQFGGQGLYRDRLLYGFADNHDVNRVASQLADADHLPLLYTALFAMPGLPSIYYGSEFGLLGKRDQHSDRLLRPPLPFALSDTPAAAPQAEATTAERFAARYRYLASQSDPAWRCVLPGSDGAATSRAASLAVHLGALAGIRARHPVLARGGYRELLVRHRQLLFARGPAGQELVVALNAERQSSRFELPADCRRGYRNLLPPYQSIPAGQADFWLEGLASAMFAPDADR